MKQIIFEELLNGLNEATEDIKRQKIANNQVIVAKPALLKPAEIAAIRKSLNASKTVFAKMLNISTETVENWETGHRRPLGSSLRLLEIAKKRPEVLIEIAKSKN